MQAITIQDKIASAPTTPGCYIYRDQKGKVLYVGKAKNIRNRVKSYFAKTEELDPRIQNMIKLAYDVEFIQTDSELEALILETNLIKKYKTKYNVLMRDDKNYIWLMFDKRLRYPMPTIVREKTVKNADYFGPYPNTMPIKRVLAMLRKVFPYCTDKAKLKVVENGVKANIKPCFYYYLNLCEGACAGKISQKEYMKNINKIKSYFRSEKAKLIDEFRHEMQQNVAERNFEKAALVRDRLMDLEFISQRVSIGRDTDEEKYKIDKEQRTQRALGELLAKLDFYQFPEKKDFKIECYDISNIQGTNAVGSMVVFVDGKSRKDLYRKFKIKTKDTPDDFAMMQEVLKRRFNIDQKKSQDPSFALNPDLIIVDGGKGQLSSAKEILKGLNLNLPVVGLAKREEEIFFMDTEQEQIVFKVRKFRSNSEAKFLVQRIRDETHRFGIQYHRRLRSIEQSKSVLDEIPGIGPVVKKRLLRAFGSIEGIKKAPRKQLLEVVKNKTTANNLLKLL